MAAKKKARLEGGPEPGAGGARWPGKFGRLRAWLEANAGEGDLDFGALEVVEQRDGQGYSVVSKAPIEEGQPIVKVPQKCVLHMGAVLASELGRVVTASGAAVHEQTVFLLFMAMGRKDEGCFWHHHFQTMPATSAHLLSWPQELLDEEFAGTHLHAAATDEAESLRADVEAVLPAIARAFPANLVPTWEDVVWAHGCYFSRRFRPELASLRPEGSTVPCMIPGLDMFNHKTGKRIAMEGDEACASLVAEERFEAGEEVFINYGHKSNEELLFGYGFAIPQNPLDIVTIQLGCRGPPEVQRYRQKLLDDMEIPWRKAAPKAGEGEGEGLEAISIGQFFVRNGEFGGVPGALLNALAVCMCQEVGEPPALALEDIAALSAKFQSKYEALEPKRAGDEQLLRRAAASGQSQDLHDLRREAAAIYRQGQRAILLEALEEMRAMTDQVGA